MILYTANNSYIYLSRVTSLVDGLQETVFTLLRVLWSRHSLKSRQLFNNLTYEGWNFNSGNYLFTTDTK